MSTWEYQYMSNNHAWQILKENPSLENTIEWTMPASFIHYLNHNLQPTSFSIIGIYLWS